MDDEPQYDYAYDNKELVSSDEKKQKILKTLNGLTNHVAHSFTDAGFAMAEQAPIPQTFNDRLNLPNKMGVGLIRKDRRYSI